jgi:TPP-dependent indolepyruvate ferredoxin oxidoreductase alpha subunit
MRAEGAVKITIVTDEPEKYADRPGLPEGIAIVNRDTLDAVQRAFREIKGTTVIIYDQTCATESAAAASAAPWSTRRAASSSTSWCARAVATAACRATASAWSRWKPSWAASARSTRAVATRICPA